MGKTNDLHLGGFPLDFVTEGDRRSHDHAAFQVFWLEVEGLGWRDREGGGLIQEGTSMVTPPVSE